MHRYAQVVLGLPLDRPFTYNIPGALQRLIRIGQRVEVSFGRRLLIGYVVGLKNKTRIKRVKALRAIVGQEPLLDEQMLRLSRQVADYYCASWGEVIEAACPRHYEEARRPGFRHYEEPEATKQSIGRQSSPGMPGGNHIECANSAALVMSVSQTPKATTKQPSSIKTIYIKEGRVRKWYTINTTARFKK